MISYLTLAVAGYVAFTKLRDKLQIDNGTMMKVFAVLVALGIIAGGSPALFGYVRDGWMKVGIPKTDWPQ